MKRAEVRRLASEVAKLLEDGAELNDVEEDPALWSALSEAIMSFMGWCLENKGRMAASPSKIDWEAHK